MIQLLSHIPIIYYSDICYAVWWSALAIYFYLRWKRDYFFEDRWMFWVLAALAVNDLLWLIAQILFSAGISSAVAQGIYFIVHRLALTFGIAFVLYIFLFNNRHYKKAISKSL